MREPFRIFVALGPYVEAELGALRRMVRDWNESGEAPRVELLPHASHQADPVEQLASADVLVLLLADRWRSSSGALGNRDAEQEYEAGRRLLDDAVRGEARTRLSQVAIFARDVSAQQVGALQEQQVATFKRIVRDDARVTYREFTSLAVFKESFGVWLKATAKTFAPGVQAADGVGESDPLHEALRLANAGLLSRAEAAFMLAVAKADDVRAFIEYGKYLRRRGRAPEAREMFERAVQRARATRDARRESDALANLAITFQALGQLDEARRLHEQALAIGESVQDSRSQAGALSGLSRVDKARGEFVRAYRLAKQSLELSRACNDRSGVAAQCANLGLLHRRCGQFEKAERWTRRALQMDEALGRDEAVARDLGNLALIHRAKGEREIAERLLARAAEINTRIGCLEGLANDYANLGQVFGERGDAATARKYHEASRELEERLGRGEGLARSHHSLGLICYSCGDTAGAERHWESAAELFDRAGLSNDSAQVRAMLAAMGAGLDPVMDAPALMRKNRPR